MGEVTPDSASVFVETITLPRIEGGGPPGVAPASAPFVPDENQDQSVVAGSDIISFVAGVSAERRRDIINCSLLAQNIADKDVSDPDHVFAWYGHYLDALNDLGWNTEERSPREHVVTGRVRAVHNEVLDLAANLLRRSAPVRIVVNETLAALEQMDDDGPWFAVWRRSAERIKKVKFQVALAEQDPDDGFVVNSMVFGLAATLEVRQFGPFKTTRQGVRMKQIACKSTVSAEALDSKREETAATVGENALAFVMEVRDSGVA